jgi:glyoxylase-like metal-dependent hydrolase (beta-lactamase superfamily II)/rhodanese-related sulfurtransferase
MIEIVTFETPELGDRSYLAHDGTVGMLVDPQRDVGRFLAGVRDAGVRVSHVLETHMHNDYVTGGLVLARLLGADYVVSAADRVAYPRQAARDGDELQVGSLRVQLLATPGHTYSHLSYLAGDAQNQVVFTGGSMLYGATGRPDLLGADRTEDLARAQFRSVRRLAGMLRDDTRVYPTHGFGSFCAATPTATLDSSTIGQQKLSNPALTAAGEDEFVRLTVAGLTPYPRYYAHMGYLNLAGPVPADFSPPAPVDPAELARQLRDGHWVVDVRNRRAYAAAHLQGSVGVELGKDFASYLGWILPWGTPVTLIGDTVAEVAKAQRDLALIGAGRAAGAFTGDLARLEQAGPSLSYPVSGFAELAKTIAGGAGPYVLDVRHDHEWADGHLAGAHHIPFEDLAQRAAEVPDDDAVWVHCRTGMRASIAASILDAAGRHPVLIDDDWDRAPAAGLTVAR